MKYLITGAAGFIGYHLSLYLLKKGFTVYGADSLNKYYSVNLKKLRLKKLKKYKNFYFNKIDLSNFNKTNKFLTKIKPDIIFH